MEWVGNLRLREVLRVFLRGGVDSKTGDVQRGGRLENECGDRMVGQLSTTGRRGRGSGSKIENVRHFSVWSFSVSVFSKKIKPVSDPSIRIQ